MVVAAALRRQFAGGTLKLWRGKPAPTTVGATISGGRHEPCRAEARRYSIFWTCARNRCRIVRHLLRSSREFRRLFRRLANLEAGRSVSYEKRFGFGGRWVCDLKHNESRVGGVPYETRFGFGGRWLFDLKHNEFRVGERPEGRARAADRHLGVHVSRRPSWG